MKWIVLEDHATKNTFIAVIGVPDSRKLVCEKEPCSYFLNKDEAMKRARQLKHNLNVNQIKVIVPEL